MNSEFESLPNGNQTPDSPVRKGFGELVDEIKDNAMKNVMRNLVTQAKNISEESQEIFSNSDAVNIIGAGLDIDEQKVWHMSDTLRRLGVIPYLSTKIKGGESSVFYTREGIIALGAITWVRSLDSRRSASVSDNVNQALRRLGTNNISSIIEMPEGTSVRRRITDIPPPITELRPRPTHHQNYLSDPASNPQIEEDDERDEFAEKLLEKKKRRETESPSIIKLEDILDYLEAIPREDLEQAKEWTRAIVRRRLSQVPRNFETTRSDVIPDGIKKIFIRVFAQKTGNLLDPEEFINELQNITLRGYGRISLLYLIKNPKIENLAILVEKLKIKHRNEIRDLKR